MSCPRYVVACDYGASGAGRTGVWYYRQTGHDVYRWTSDVRFATVITKETCDDQYWRNFRHKGGVKWWFEEVSRDTPLGNDGSYGLTPDQEGTNASARTP